MIEAIAFVIMVIVIGFFGLLALAGILILLVIVVGVPLAVIVRKFMPDRLV
jgi:hypothetical protein